ncbi:MAG TPA: phenylalanine--tRNA ligase subunit beta, partial [Nitrospirae bacterium]|nr:phenylalanine--tRNA ligase subunit beta [Nitrospirota bacterium]
MKASIKWLKEFVDFSAAPSEVAEALTMAGLEVESIEESEDDTVLELGITPNRPDCLSIRGIAREISAIYKLPFNDKTITIENEKGVRPKIEINDPDLCPRYTSRILNRVKVAPSPDWMRGRLELHGLRPINNIVDITNYVLLEMGHPLHAFDLKNLEGQSIAVRTAGSESKFQTLDSENRTLNSDMLMIWDSKKPVAIAGIMGGLNTEVTESTVNILLESAYFNPVSIRKSSKALNLSTDSSYRFERGADIRGLVTAIDRATQLILEIAGGVATKRSDIYLKPFVPKVIPVKLWKIEKILGIKIDLSLIQEILTALGLKTSINEMLATVTTPSFRHDLQTDIDVIEEIARLYGYDKIPSTLPKMSMKPANENHRWQFIKNIKESMRQSGYSEVINYSFLNPSALDKLRLSPEDIRREMIRIRNPLKKEEEALRTTLIPAILDNVRFNVSRGEKSLSLYEISTVFLNSGEKLPDEQLEMSAVFLKNRESCLWQTDHDPFYDLKGAVEKLLHEFRISNYSFIQDDLPVQPYVHPGKSCVIRVNDHDIGIIGTLHPEVAESFDVSPETNILELNIDKLLESIPSKITFRPLPKFPYVERDIAVIIPDDITSEAVESVILDNESD